MCGIAVIYPYNNSSDRPIDPEMLKAMCDVLAHRGPDDEGYFIDSSIGLGMRRLSIIDLDTGHQPIHNEDKTLWGVLNGTIYNFQELRKNLEKKHGFYTESDTEVILHLYEEYGEECVNHLRGMFVLALWDTRQQKLFIAKDRLGKKPFYYTRRNGTLVFASEIKSILEYLKETPEINYKAIDSFLTYQYIPSPETIYKDVYSLPPAHTISCDKSGDIKISRYWDLDFTKKIDIPFEEACRMTRKNLEEATRLRLISDVPLGAFLSGGLDSSIIVGLMNGLSSRPVKTFSVGFEEDDFSEIKYARIVARHFKTEHNEFILKQDFIESLPEIVRHYGQPFADASALPSYLLSHETKKYVTVALNGDGGDESFGGYLRYQAMKGSLLLYPLFRLMGEKTTDIISNIVPHTETAEGKNIFRYMSRLVSGLSHPPAGRNDLWHSCFTDAAKAPLYSDQMKAAVKTDGFSYLQKIFENAEADNVMDKTFYTDINAYLPECLLVKMDVASMANSLETRSPFLDHNVMEFSASLPCSWKVHGLTTKYILKETFKDFLPDEIVNRRKTGFGIPLGKWFRGEWKKYFRETVLSEKAINRGYFKKAALENIYHEHIEGKKDHGYRMWTLLILELWHSIFYDRGHML